MTEPRSRTPRYFGPYAVLGNHGAAQPSTNAIAGKIDRRAPRPSRAKTAAHVARARPSPQVRVQRLGLTRSGVRLRSAPQRTSASDRGSDICNPFAQRHPRSESRPLTRGFTTIIRWAESQGSTPPTPHKSPGHRPTASSALTQQSPGLSVENALTRAYAKRVGGGT